MALANILRYFVKSRMRKICTYGSVRGTEDTANSHYDILEQYKVEKRGECRGSVYSTNVYGKINYWYYV